MAFLVLRDARLARLIEPVELKIDFRSFPSKPFYGAWCPSLAGQGVMRELVVHEGASQYLLSFLTKGVKFACVRLLRPPEVWTTENLMVMLDAIEKILLPGGVLELDVSWNRNRDRDPLPSDYLWNITRSKCPNLELRLNYMGETHCFYGVQHDLMTADDEAAITRLFVAMTKERSGPAAAKAIQRIWRRASCNPNVPLGDRVLRARFAAHLSEAAQ
jgi:hypothetical protein